MIRLLKIARREYLAYVRTAGFWLSLCLTPLGLAIGLVGPAMLMRSAPPPRIAVVDLTGDGYRTAIEQALKTTRPGRPGAPSMAPAVLVAAPAAQNASVADVSRSLRADLVRAPSQDRAPLDAAAVVHRDGPSVVIDFWSRNVSDPATEATIKDAVAGRMSALRLQALGVKPADVAAADALEPRMVDYSAKAGRKAALRDRLPAFAGFGLGILLFMMIFTSAGILLNSVIEEKSSRILEVLLASASAGEIMGGKILGVAAVTATVLAVWFGVGGALLASSNPHLAREILAVLVGRGLILVFAVYLVGGYLIYAALFTAIGAHCETNREAQTLLAPMMMITVIPVMFLSQSLTRPDAPALAALSWFPLCTPFLAPARAAADTSPWQMAGTAALTALTAAGSLYVSGRAFRAGALSSGRGDGRSLFLRVFRPSID